MIVIFLLIPLSVVIAACFLGAFIWAVRSGQFNDTCTPAMRVLLEEERRGLRAADLQPAEIVGAEKSAGSNPAARRSPPREIFPTP